jgi:hypothetical protein
MRKPTSPTADASLAPPRDRMELIRFRTKDDLRKAMSVFRHFTSPEITFTFRDDWPDDTCVTNTATVRALQALGCPFEWLTEHLEPSQP